MFRTTYLVAAALSFVALYSGSLVTSASPALVSRATAPPADPFTQVFSNLTAAVDGGNDYLTFILVDTNAGKYLGHLKRQYF
jgi:hypothetical protein